MNGLENSTYVTLLLISNVVAFTLLFISWKLPRLGRLLFFMLFAWAGWMNWHTAINSPTSYLEYGNLSFFNFYKNFINGWFKQHLLLMVGVIATCQLLISIGMLSRGIIFKIACIAGIIFLVAIAPLGVGSAFPCTLILAIDLYLLFRRSPNYLWLKEPVVQY